MTTKEQERAALKKIRDLITGLGEESYIGAAFAGCLEDAESNIENDFWLSMQDRYQTAERKLESMKADNARLGGIIDITVDKLITEKDAHEEDRKALAACKDEVASLTEDLTGARSRISDLENEIVHLKAKLYDMMVAGA